MDRMLEAFFPDASRVLSAAVPNLWQRLSACNVPFVVTPSLLSFSGSPIITFPSVMMFACVGFSIGIVGSVRCFSSSEMFWRSQKISRATARHWYGMSFLCFALMNLSALFAHCLCPPEIYIRGLEGAVSASLSSQHSTVTHIARVLDICSTGCSCACFVLGRLFELQLLDAHSQAATRSAAALPPVLYCLGLWGLRAPALPFLAEALYPGACGLMPVLVPLLRWPAHKLGWLLLAGVAFGFAFLGGLLEKQLCETLGAHWTGPAVCFAMCDVMFVALANLIDVNIF